MRITITFGPEGPPVVVVGTTLTAVEPTPVEGPDGAVGEEDVQAIKTMDSAQQDKIARARKVARARIGHMVSLPRLPFHLLDVEMTRTVPRD